MQTTPFDYQAPPALALSLNAIEMTEYPASKLVEEDVFYTILNMNGISILAKNARFLRKDQTIDERFYVTEPVDDIDLTILNEAKQDFEQSFHFMFDESEGSDSIHGIVDIYRTTFAGKFFQHEKTGGLYRIYDMSLLRANGQLMLAVNYMKHLPEKPDVLEANVMHTRPAHEFFGNRRFTEVMENQLP